MSFTPATLGKLFLFDTKLGQTEETQHEKLLYYYPESTPTSRQLTDIGLSEALVNFTKTFSQDKPCEAVHLEKSRQAFFECEPGIWLVLTVNNPHTTTATKDGTTQCEYDSEEVSDSALQQTAAQAYRMFKLFNGTFERITNKGTVDDLRTSLAMFMPHFLKAIDFSHVDIFSALDGVHFLPVDKNVYLRVQSFINWTENTFPQIKHSCFFYRDHLIWSALDQDDLRILYKYLVDHILSSLSSSSSSSSLASRQKQSSPRRMFMGRKSGSNTPVSTSPSLSRRENGATSDTASNGQVVESALPFHFRDPAGDGYVTGPLDLNDKETHISCPFVFLGPTNERHRLIIYEHEHMFCLFFIKGDSSKLNTTFFSNLKSFILPQLQFLKPILGDHWDRKQGYADEYRYIYFNHMNLALKTSLRNKGAEISREHMKILNDMHADFEKSTDDISELMARTQSDGWIIGRKSDQREFYVLFDNRNANLLEINGKERSNLSSL
ncbi:vacuolar fusion protein ccz1, variant 2 [Balamuthia mandrillaris]